MASLNYFVIEISLSLFWVDVKLEKGLFFMSTNMKQNSFGRLVTKVINKNFVNLTASTVVFLVFCFGLSLIGFTPIEITELLGPVEFEFDLNVSNK